MERETLEALKGSIQKWRGITNGEGVDKGSNNCPLCHKFLDRKSGTCFGCPVYEHTKEHLCVGTPYDNYGGDPSYENALEELEFLESLLPEETS